jgi:ubiquinone/menaquinone biosynthesis C-methylase UbiE
MHIKNSGLNEKTQNLSKEINWLSKKDYASIYTLDYWNNISEEKKKEWWIEDGNYKKCLDYLTKNKLFDEYFEAENEIKKLNRKNLKVVDLASGIGWISALLSKLIFIKYVYAIDISEHRIKKLFPHSIKMLNGKPEKIKRFIGSFYKTKFKKNSMDIIILSQSFHHAENPFELLSECKRILKPSGRIILIGEHYIGIKKIIIRFFSELLKYKKITFDFYNLFKTNKITGDHYYKLSDYKFLFMACNLNVEIRKSKNGGALIIAKKVNV